MKGENMNYYLFTLVSSVTVNSLHRLCICLDLYTLNLDTWNIIFMDLVYDEDFKTNSCMTHYVLHHW